MDIKKKILITGATGFVGNHVINYLLKNTSHDVIASSRSIDKAKDFSWFEKVTYVPWSIGTKPSNTLYNDFHSPDLCIHLAWDGLPHFKNEEHIDIFFKNHLDFLSTLIDQGLPKLSVTGTCLEYGMREGELKEEMPSEPTLAYPIGKNKLRIALELKKTTIPFELDWVRLFYMFGEGQNPKSILAQLDKHLDENKPVFNMSAGEQVRDYLPVEKIAEVIAKLATHNEGNGIINCCSGVPITIKQLVEDHMAEKNAQIELNLGYYPYPDYEPFKFWGSTKKLDELLKD